MTDDELDRRLAACEERREKRYSQHDASAEEIALIRDRVFLVEPDIVYAYETAFQSTFSVRVMKEQLQHLTAGLDRHALVVDLTRAHKPDAETRRELRTLLLDTRLVHVSVFTGANLLLHVAARFVLAPMQTPPFGVVTSRRDAIERARAALRAGVRRG